MQQAQQKKIILHGSAVVLESPAHPPAAVFIRGSSGSGKSDLCLRLLRRGAGLIGDDQVTLERRQDKIQLSPVDSIRGLIEVRGIGLLRHPSADAAWLRLVIDLVPQAAVPRLPERETVDILGIAIPLFRLHAFDASAPDKLAVAMEAAFSPDLLID